MTVVPRPGNEVLEGALGAAVNVLAWASDTETYRAQVERALGNADFDVEEVANAKPFDPDGVSDDVLEAAGRTRETREVSWGTFYSYDSEDDD